MKNLRLRRKEITTSYHHLITYRSLKILNKNYMMSLPKILLFVTQQMLEKKLLKSVT